MATRSKISVGRVRDLYWIVCARKLALTVDEGVQDRHGAVGDTGVGVDLLEDWIRVSAKIASNSKRCILVTGRRKRRVRDRILQRDLVLARGKGSG